MELNEDSHLELFSEPDSSKRRREGLALVWKIGSWRSFVFEIKPLFPDSIARAIYALYLRMV